MVYEVYPIYGLEIEFNSATGRFDEIITELISKLHL
jgi:hypothetical protein